MAILLTLIGNHPNMGASQKFDTQEQFDSWLKEHTDNFFPNLKQDGKTLTFDGGSGITETVLDSFDNCKEESVNNPKN